MVFGVGLALTSPVSAAELRLPPFKALDLMSYLPVVHGQIPINKIVINPNQLPEWKRRWDAARLTARQGGRDKAVSMYQELLDLKENLQEARWELTVLLLQEERWPDAARQVDRLLSREPERGLYLLVKAFLAQQAGEYERALDLFKRGGAGDSQDPLVLSGMVNSLFYLGRKEEALAGLERLLSRRPEDDLLVYDYVVLAFELGHDEAALPYLESFTKGEASPGRLLLAVRLLRRLSMEKESLSYCRRLLLSRPENQEALVCMAAYYEEEGIWAKALEPLYALADRNPKDAVYLKRIALAHMGMENYSEAENYLREYLKKVPGDTEAAQAMIKLQASKGDRQATLAALEHYFSIESNPDAGDLQQAARLYRQAGFLQEAVSIYRRLLSMTPDEPGLMWDLAKTLMASGQVEDSLRVWRELSKAAPGVIEVYRPMAEILESLGRERELLEVLAIIHRLDPKDQWAVFRLAGLYFKEGDFARLAPLLGSIRGTGRKRPEFFLWRGSVRLRERHYTGALADFEALLALRPGDGPVVAKCLFLSGMTADLPRVRRYAALLQDNSPGFNSSDALLTARSYERAGALTEAERVFVKVAEAEDEKGTASAEKRERGAAFWGLYGIYRQEERPFAALQALRQGWAVARSMRCARALLEIAVRDGDLQGADRWLAEMESEGDYWDYLMARATYLNATGQDAEVDEFRGRLQELAASTSQGDDGANWRRQLLDLIDLDISRQRYEAALRLCQRLEKRDAGSPEAILEESRIHSLSFGRLGRESSLASLSGDLSLMAARFFEERLMYAELEGVAVRQGSAPSSLRWGLYLAQARHALGDDGGALAIYERVFAANPGELNLAASLAHLYFAKGRLAEVSTLLDTFPTLQRKRPDILRLRARVLWLNHDWSGSIASYRSLLSPRAQELLERSGVAQDGCLPQVETKKSFLEDLGLRASPQQELLEKVLAGVAPAPGGVCRPSERHLLEAEAAGLYSLLRWQKKFTLELEVREAVKGRQYVMAAKEYEGLWRREPEGLNLAYDLAGVYGRLGRLGEEAAIYDMLRARGVAYPGMDAAVARNRARRRPYVSGLYSYSNEDGWDGSKDMEANRLDTTFWYSPDTKRDAGLTASVLNYQGINSRDTVRGQRLFGKYAATLWPGVRGRLGLGVDRLDDGAKDLFLFDGAVTAKFGDRLAGDITLSRDLVADTPRSVREAIAVNSVRLGGRLDIVPRFELSGNAFYDDFSDNNWTRGYDFQAAYIIFSESAFIKADYRFDFKDSKDGDLLLPQSTTSRPVLEHPYWSPTNFWKNSFGIFLRQSLAKDSLEREAPCYYTAEYRVGHYSNGDLFQDIKAAGTAQMGPAFTAEVSGELNNSPSYMAKKIALSLSYRW